MTKQKTPTQTEREIATDEAQQRSVLTGEVLREKGLCPLVVLRTYGAGVHVGYLARVQGQEAELLEARRIYSWYGANTLNEVSHNGIAENSRISEPVPYIALTSVLEVLPVSEKATKSLITSRWNT